MKINLPNGELYVMGEIEAEEALLYLQKHGLKKFKLKYAKYEQSKNI